MAYRKSAWGGDASIPGLGICGGNRKSPCMNCEDRTPECHGKCLRYIDWQQAYYAEKQIEMERRTRERLLNQDAVKRKYMDERTRSKIK